MADVGGGSATFAQGSVDEDGRCWPTTCIERAEAPVCCPFPADRGPPVCPTANDQQRPPPPARHKSQFIPCRYSVCTSGCRYCCLRSLVYMSSTPRFMISSSSKRLSLCSARLHMLTAHLSYLPTVKARQTSHISLHGRHGKDSLYCSLS